MSILRYNFIFIASFFPQWIFIFNIENQLKILVLFFLFFLISAHNVLYKYLINKNLYLYLYLSLIFTYGIDNSLSLYSDFLIQNFKVGSSIFLNNYIVGLFILIILWLFNFTIIKKLELNGIKIITVFICSILIYNFFYSEKLFKNFPDFNKSNHQKKFDNPTIVFIMDQMAGINSSASETNEGKLFDELAINFSKRNKATIYKNIYSSCPMTYDSIPLMLNFDTSDDCRKQSSKFSKRTSNFYNRDLISKNMLFDKFTSISVFQNYFVNYCNHKNVIKCDQYSQFKKYKNIDGIKDNSFSSIIGGWKHHGSIAANIVWRFLLQYNFILSYEQASGEKISFLTRLDSLENDLLSKKYDLILFYSLASHEPYGFNEECKFDNNKYIDYKFYDYDQRINAHNLDRTCVIKFLDKFMEKVKNKKNFNKLNFIIVSDHGTRLKPDPKDTLNSILIYKKNNGSFEEISEKKNIQKEFGESILHIVN